MATHPRAILITTGQRFGRLRALSETRRTRQGAYWLCVCDCGKTKEVAANSLAKGLTQSCGCLRRAVTIERFTTHGMAHSPEWRIWHHMKERTTNPQDKSYPGYGGRGIVVCVRWNESFANFYADMGPRPTPQHQLERRNNEGNYEPQNCYWATATEQANNRRTSHTLTHQGKTQTIAEWAREIGVSYHTLWLRITRHGWTVEDALTTPAQIHKYR